MTKQKVNVQCFASVLDAIKDTAGKAVPMNARSELMTAISGHIAKNGLTQAAAAMLFSVAKPRVSELVRGKIELFPIDTPVQMLASAGMRVEMKLKKAA